MINRSWKYFVHCFLLVSGSVALIFLTSIGWNFFSLHVDGVVRNPQSQERLKEDVIYLSESIGTRNYAYPQRLEAAAVYIERSLANTGMLVESWYYEARGQRFRNIVARYKNNPSEEYILIGAHYDSCFNPGADDNASGVAGLLELARSLKMSPMRANVMFVAFTNEEPPFFKTSDMGSRVFVKSIAEKGIKVRSAIVLEMIGFYSHELFSQKYLPLMGPFYPNRGDFIAIIGDLNSRGLVKAVQKHLGASKDIISKAVVAPAWVPGINFSDHASFWEADIPAVMVTDTAYLRNGNYHQPTDTAGSLDFVRMAGLVEGLNRVVVDLGQE